MTVAEFFNDLVVLLPFTFILTWGTVLIIVDMVVPEGKKGSLALLAALGMVVGIVLSVLQTGQQTTAFDGKVVVDGFSIFMNVLFLGIGLVGVTVAYDYLKRMGLERGEYYILLVFSISGMMLMGSANDLIIVFLALELLSIPLYVLSGIARPQEASEEAGIKYFLMGAFASGFVVYGIALIFGMTGTTAFPGILAAVSTGSILNPLIFTIGGGLLLIGLGFKVAAVPFHMWTPDVYEGAPSAVTAFMSAGAKAAGFAALLRVFVVALPSISVDMTAVFWVVSALTMILGNVVAIAQTNIKRMLAYSSIAHAGYIMMALVLYGQPQLAPAAVSAALFYLVAYSLTNFGAWAVVIALEQKEGKGLLLADYAGLGRKHLGLAIAMTIFMLSFIGVPPTLGFVGKFYLFGTVIAGGYLWLALIAVLTSLVSAYYYLRVVGYMFMRDGEPLVRRDTFVNLTAGVTAVGLVALTIFATPLFNWVTQALLSGF
jgi:NADH-quinone oxidoreductase subunit N